MSMVLLGLFAWQDVALLANMDWEEIPGSFSYMEASD